MIKKPDRIDHDIKSKPLSEDESRRLSQVIIEYKKQKKAKRKKPLSRKKTLL
jgi:hypothetical protein